MDQDERWAAVHDESMFNARILLPSMRYELAWKRESEAQDGLENLTDRRACVSETLLPVTGPAHHTERRDKCSDVVLRAITPFRRLGRLGRARKRSVYVGSLWRSRKTATRQQRATMARLRCKHRSSSLKGAGAQRLKQQ